MANEIPDLYQVKYRRNGSRKWRYGIVNRYSDDALKEWNNRRLLLVEDAVLPIAEWVDFDNSEIVEISLLSYPNEFDAYVEKELEKAQEKSDAATGLKDKMFAVGVADGSAYYVVTKENKKTVKIEWRGFCPDRWTDHFFGYGGSFDKNRIASMIKRNEGLRELFSEGKE